MLNLHVLYASVYSIAHFILLHILLIFSYYFYFNLYLYIYYLVLLHILDCPLSRPDLIYISLLIISCIIEYVTSKRTLNLSDCLSVLGKLL